MSRFLRVQIVQTSRSSAVSLFQADFESGHVVRSSGCSANQSLVIGNALATQLLFHWQWYVMIAMIGNDNNANHHVPHMNIYIYFNKYIYIVVQLYAYIYVNVYTIIYYISTTRKNRPPLRCTQARTHGLGLCDRQGVQNSTGWQQQSRNWWKWQLPILVLY